MTIKEVERVTGLTAKSIRYYEEKGLLKVERNEENSYRVYTEENVEQLKWIRIFRYLNFSIEEIKVILSSDSEQAKKMLGQKTEQLQDEIDGYSIKKELCFVLSKDYENRDAVLEEYEDTIDFLTSDDMDEVKDILQEAKIISKSEIILYTLILIAPIIWLFINISRNLQSALLLNALLALISTVFLTKLWGDYFRQRSIYKEKAKAKDKSTQMLITKVLLTIIISFVGAIGIDHLITGILAPANWLFYQLNVYTEWLMIVWIVCGVLALISFNTLRNQNNKMKLIVFLVWLIIGYVCITSVTFVTEQEIIIHTPLEPQGKVYEYKDIDRVETSFGESDKTFIESDKKGNFSYTVFINGQKVVFCVPTPNEEIVRYSEDTYLELEEFDKALMNLGIYKEVDMNYVEYCDLEAEYVERFVRIATTISK